MRGLLDQTDLRILERLQEDGRMPFARIARDLGLAEATVRQRVNRLVRRGLVQIVAVADPLQLGLLLAEMGVRVRGRLEETIDALRRIPEIDYVAVCTGSFDLLIEVVVTDHDHLLRVLAEGVRPAPGVDQVETFTILRVAKDTYRYTSLALAAGPTDHGRSASSDLRIRS